MELVIECAIAQRFYPGIICEGCSEFLIDALECFAMSPEIIRNLDITLLNSIKRDAVSVFRDSSDHPHSELGTLFQGFREGESSGNHIASEMYGIVGDEIIIEEDPKRTE